MKLRVRCRDKYEAQKLVSLIYRDDDNDTFVTKILNVIENEVVVSLKDKSAHSVLLKDSQNVEALVDFLQSVFEKKHKIVGAATFQDEVEVIKE
ncbi:MAG: hypothetical protein NPMRTH5_1130001 [Nitrosopumilales archaeon]|nr:MAG: hypothetical protein NPMRTH5_1130001 [Nitrosopumilales archaeon]